MSEFPRVATVWQRFPRPRVESIEQAVTDSFRQVHSSLPSLQGKEIAVAVGSRGIARLDEIVRATLATLDAAGARPFLVPAMGSHGGATAQGQERILEGYGVSSGRLGVPLVSTLETRLIGSTPDGVPVHLDRAAWESDGIVLINRVKPHTDFKGEVESGLQKMLAVGLGNRDGADSFHSWTMQLPYDRLIATKARVALDSGRIVAGVAIVENAYHEPARIELVPAARIPEREKPLLAEATRLMPALPVRQTDVLIVDRIGKDVSGAGMDPNVTGRWFRIHSIRQEQPDITRIVVLGLTPASEGNAVGIGLADFCSGRVVRQLDREKTYINAVTSRNVVAGHLPVHFETDRLTLQRCLQSLRAGVDAGQVRLLRIRDTSTLDRLEASEALLGELKGHPTVERVGRLREMSFDSQGRLASPLDETHT